MDVILSEQGQGQGDWVESETVPYDEYTTLPPYGLGERLVSVFQCRGTSEADSSWGWDTRTLHPSHNRFTEDLVFMPLVIVVVVAAAADGDATAVVDGAAPDRRDVVRELGRDDQINVAMDLTSVGCFIAV